MACCFSCYRMNKTMSRYYHFTFFRDIRDVWERRHRRLLQPIFTITATCMPPATHQGTRREAHPAISACLRERRGESCPCLSLIPLHHHAHWQTLDVCMLERHMKAGCLKGVACHAAGSTFHLPSHVTKTFPAITHTTSATFPFVSMLEKLGLHTHTVIMKKVTSHKILFLTKDISLNVLRGQEACMKAECHSEGQQREYTEGTMRNLSQ